MFKTNRILSLVIAIMMVLASMSGLSALAEETATVTQDGDASPFRISSARVFSETAKTCSTSCLRKARHVATVRGPDR